MQDCSCQEADFNLRLLFPEFMLVAGSFLLGFQLFLRMGCPSTLVCSRRNQSFSTRTFHGNGWQGKDKIVCCSGLANGGTASKFRCMSTMSATAVVRFQFEKVSTYERIPTC
jgi:hypothetical protein